MTNLCVIRMLALLLTLPALGQDKGQNTVTAQKDPKAMAIAQRTLSTLASTFIAEQTDVLLSGTYVLHANDGDQSLPVTIKCKGTDRIRVEGATEKGSSTRIVNHGKGVVVGPSKTINLNDGNTARERVLFVPALSLIAEIADPNISVQMATKNDDPNILLLDIGLGFQTPSEDVPQMSVRYFVNSTTFLVDRVEYLLQSQNHRGMLFKIARTYSDYRNVSGFLVPFRQSTLVDGDRESDLTLDSATFNSGISDLDFQLPEVQ